MKVALPEQVEGSRITTGPLASSRLHGANGAFLIDIPNGASMQVIASNGAGWDHVSVCPRYKKRCPTWQEMHYIKDLFFAPDEVVIQYHPARANYVNNHEFVLHLWKPQGVELPTPPDWMVGYKARKRHAQPEQGEGV